MSRHGLVDDVTMHASAEVSMMSRGMKIPFCSLRNGECPVAGCARCGCAGPKLPVGEAENERACQRRYKEVRKDDKDRTLDG